MTDISLPQLTSSEAQGDAALAFTIGQHEVLDVPPTGMLRNPEPITGTTRPTDGAAEAANDIPMQVEELSAQEDGLRAELSLPYHKYKTCRRSFSARISRLLSDRPHVKPGDGLPRTCFGELDNTRTYKYIYITRHGPGQVTSGIFGSCGSHGSHYSVFVLKSFSIYIRGKGLSSHAAKWIDA